MNTKENPRQVDVIKTKIEAVATEVKGMILDKIAFIEERKLPQIYVYPRQRETPLNLPIMIHGILVRPFQAGNSENENPLILNKKGLWECNLSSSLEYKGRWFPSWPGYEVDLKDWLRYGERMMSRIENIKGQQPSQNIESPEYYEFRDPGF